VPPNDDACSPKGAKSAVAEPQFEPSDAIAPAANADCVATADSAKAVASIPAIEYSLFMSAYDDPFYPISLV
jgi:hypothetical protein